MAMLGLRVPLDTARLIWGIPCDFGQRESIDEAHITVLYLGEDTTKETLARAILVTHEVVQGVRPFSLSVDRVTTFPPSEDGVVPIICPVQSEALHALRSLLADAFDAEGIDYSRKFPVYKPHVTLAYASDPSLHKSPKVNKPFPKVVWGASEVVLWGGVKGEASQFLTSFPLTLVGSKQAMWRGLVRLASLF